MKDVVNTPSGAMRGELSAHGRTLVVRSVHYAEPPVGPLRWRPPRRPASWTGVREHGAFGPIAIQQPRTATSVFPGVEEPQSEDCLTLNVWTGSTDPSERRPVIVWFGPGAYQSGSGSAPMYHGDAWARAGAVLVTLNYRLGKVGFLAHPDLFDEDPAGTAGNYGLLDQIAALEWVREHISAFGGDPGCVTIFGVSSGASSVSLLMTAPAARGLFHRAIAESGGSFGPLGATTDVGDRWQTLEAALASGKAWAAAIGAPHLADLRALSADELRKAGARAPDATRDVFDAARPVIDGQVLPGASRAMFEAGLQAAVPLLVGCAANEDFGMLCYARDLATYRAEAEADHGADSAEFLSLYPANDDRQALAASLKSNGHRLFTWQNWTWANLHAKAGHDVYYYRFDQAPPVPDGRYVEQQHPRPLGAFHGASIFYSFDRFWLREDWPWSAGDREVSRSLTAAWVNFARTGKPKAPGLPLWPQFEPKDPQVMAVCEAAALRPVPDRPYIDFWDRFYARRQAGSP